MPVIRAQVIWQRRSHLAKDAVVNNFAFGVASGYPAGALDGIYAALKAFYDTTYAASGALKSFLSQELVTAPVISDATATRTVKLFDMGQASPRVPVLESTDNPVVGQSSRDNLPAEVAVVLSFQAQKTSGLNQAQRRGRIFLGPLNDHAGAGVSNYLVSSDLITIGLAAMQDLAAKSAAAANWTWGVYSEPFAGRPETPRPGKSTLPALPARAGHFAPVHDVWMDDAFDTQRRRGSQPTLRQTATADASNAVVIG